MARTLEIDIWGYNWDITDKSDERSDSSAEPKGKFGIWRVFQGKINYLFDYYMHESAIKESKSDPLFSEVCEFVYPAEEIRFTGTFIDALEFIENRLPALFYFKDGEQPKGDLL